MSAIVLGTLRSKFQPFLLGSSTCPAQIKAEIDPIFKKPLARLKRDYIFDGGKWILKLGRRDGLSTTSDTHLYRVRKAAKIRTYIQQNHLEDHIAVPRKYLYWHPEQEQFYVVSEKMDLSTEVATPASRELEQSWKEIGSEYGGQLEALASNAPKRSLTPTQAKALAELSVLGYTDLTYNNLYFTKDGKVAIIDTEPHKRSLKKERLSTLFFRLFGDKQSVLTQQSIIGIGKLKLYTDRPDALREIEKVEKKHVLWRIAVLITKISLVILGLYFTPTITALIPITTLAQVLKVSFIGVGLLKNFILGANVASVYLLWSLSCQGLNGVGRMGQMEQVGLI